MKTEITVAAKVRNTRGKNEANRTRMAGQIPAVVYGANQDPVAVAVDPRAISQIMRSGTGYNTIFSLVIEGGDTTPVMIVDHQNDPIKSTLLHADFKRVDLTKRIRVTIPVLFAGEPKGVKTQGGHFEIVNRSVEIECLPNEIPGNFTLDMTEVMLGDSKRASDIPLTGSIKLLSPADELLAHVIAMRGEEEAAPAAEGAPVAGAPEPEVIKKGKKEEEAEDKKKK